MSTSPRFEIEPAPIERVERPKGCLRSCLGGCLIALVVLAIVGVIGGFWVSRNWRRWTSDWGSAAIKQSIETSDLDPQEKDEVNAQVERAAAAFRDGRLSLEQAQALLEKLVESPLMSAIVASAAEEKYIDRSGLNDEEKDAARQTMRRFFRGALDGAIDQAGIDAAMMHVADQKSGGDWELRDKVSDEDLRAFLDQAKAAADKAQVPPEPEDIDPSDELKRIIDEALNVPDPPPGPEPAA